MAPQKELLSAITQYLDSDKPSYAVLMDGEWGSGKTFFWKTQIVPWLEKNDRKFLYVSLYGLTKPEDIDRRLLFSQFPILKHGMMEAFTKLTKAGLDHFKISLPLKSLKADLSDRILCFDDLERISELVSTSDVLGYINSFVEHENLKTIIIANEKELLQKESSAENRSYARIKEKLIWRTFIYKPEIDEVITSMSIDYDETYKEFIHRNKHSIQRIIGIKKQSNLRVIKATLDDYKNIYVHAKNLNLPTGSNKEPLIERLFELFFVIQLEIKTDITKAPLLKRLFGDEYLSAIVSLDKKSTKPDERYLSDVINNYFNGKIYDLHSFASTYKYIVDGYFDKSQFDKEISGYFKSQGTEEEKRRRYFFGDYHKLDDKDFEIEAKSVLKELEEGQYTQLPELVKLAHRLFFYADINLLGVTPTKLRELFIRTIKKHIANGDTKFSDLESSAPSAFYEYENAQYKKLKEFIYKTDNQLRKNSIKEDVRHLTEILSQSFLGGIAALDSDKYRYLVNEPLFSYIDPNIFVSLIKKQNSEAIVALIQYLKSRYSHSSMTRLKPEEKNIRLIARQLRHNASTKSGKVSGVALDSLIKIFDSAAKKLNQA